MKFFTKETDYAIQLMSTLAHSKATVSLRKFSVESGISFLFLQRIAKKLRESGLIESEHGRTGGYRLIKGAKHITLSEIVEAIEGKPKMVACTECPLNIICTFPKLYERLDNEISAVLKKKTLASFLMPEVKC